jgi:hypothetical protein
MSDIYTTEIEPLIAGFSNLPYDEIMSMLSDVFMGLRTANNKKYYGQNTTTDIRRRAIITAACCVAVVRNLDAVKEDISLDGNNKA